MAFTTKYSFNIKQDTGLAAEKQWVVDIVRLPSTVASGGTAGSDTTGPLGSGGTATANITHGDATNTGFATMLDAVQRAMTFILDDRSLNG